MSNFSFNHNDLYSLLHQTHKILLPLGNGLFQPKMWKWINPLQTITRIYWFIADDSRNHLWLKEKLLILSNFSFYHNDFNPTKAISSHSITMFFVICDLFEFGTVQKLSFGKGFMGSTEVDLTSSQVLCNEGFLDVLLGELPFYLRWLKKTKEEIAHSKQNLL